MGAQEQLAGAKIFHGVPSTALAACAPLWVERVVPETVVLWAQGEAGDELALLVQGQLAARVQGQEVGLIEAGEVVGEISAFFKEVRTATVQATCDSHLLVLPAANLAVLRRRHTEVYDLLLDHALTAQARRVHAVNQQISRLASGTADAPTRRETSPLKKLLARLTGPQGEAPPTLPVLRRLPVLRSAPAEVLEALGQHLTPRRLEVGQPLFLEGDEGESLLLLGSGVIEVLRNVRSGKAERLALLTEGALLGTGSLLLRERRNASCVSAATSWVFELDRRTWLGLTGEPGRLLRESLLSALRHQLLGAGVKLAHLKKGKAAQRQLRSAAAELTAFLASPEAQDPWLSAARAPGVDPD